MTDQEVGRKQSWHPGKRRRRQQLHHQSCQKVPEIADALDTGTMCTMPYHDLGTPSQSAVTHHNALCLVPDSDSAQLPVSDLLSRQLVFNLFFLKTHPLQICMCQSLL